MVGGAVAYRLDCRNLVHGNATISPGFLGYRLDGTTYCGGARVFAHGGGHGTLGRAVVFHWHSPLSGWAGTHAPLPGLIPRSIRSPRHESAANLPGPQRDDALGPRGA